MIKIYYIPHAATKENLNHIASGHSPVELAPEGIKEAESLRKAFKDIHFDAAYTSDLPRARQTAEIVLYNTNVEIIDDNRLREIDYGDHTGVSRSEVREKRLDHLHVPFPGGESYDDVLARYTSFLGGIRAKHKGRTIAICAHGIYPLEVLINKKPIEEALFDWVDGYRTFEL